MLSGVIGRRSAGGCSEKPAGHRWILCVATTAVLTIVPASGSSAVSEGQSRSAVRGLEWLKQQQYEDGSYPGFSATGGTAEVVYGIVAAGQDPASDAWRSKSGATAVSWLEAETQDPGPDASGADPRDAADLAAKVAMAAVVSENDPRNFGGVNLMELIAGHYDAASGTYSGQFGPSHVAQSLAMLGLAAGRQPIPTRAVDYLLAEQLEDGGWTYPGGASSLTEPTALAIQALVSAEEQGYPESDIDDAVKSSLEFYHRQQTDDGGFSFDKSQAANFCGGDKVGDANSTAYSIQAIRAAGGRPTSIRWRKGDATPVSALMDLQNPDGSFNYQDGPDCDNQLSLAGATSQAVPGVLERSFVCLVGLSPCPALSKSRSAVSKEETSGEILAEDEDDDGGKIRRRSRRLSFDLESHAGQAGSNEIAPLVAPATLSPPPTVPGRPAPRQAAKPVPNPEPPVPASPVETTQVPQTTSALEAGRSQPDEVAAAGPADPGKDNSAPYLPVLGGLALVGALSGSIINQLCKRP